MIYAIEINFPEACHCPESKSGYDSGFYSNSVLDAVLLKTILVQISFSVHVFLNWTINFSPVPNTFQRRILFTYYHFPDRSLSWSYDVNQKHKYHDTEKFLVDILSLRHSYSNDANGYVIC